MPSDKKAEKQKATKEEVVKANENGEADPMSETKMIEIDFLETESALYRAKEKVSKKVEEIKHKAETCIRKLGQRNKA